MPSLGSLQVLDALAVRRRNDAARAAGVVDAVVVESDLYLSTSFESLREELDP